MNENNFTKEKANSPCFIIAEAGVNHNGSIKNAKKLVDIAKKANVNAVKFQTFQTDQIVSIKTQKASYQERAKEHSQYEMLKNLELNYDEFREIKEYCDNKNIEFISTPYDIESVGFLNELGVEWFKIASADIINKPLIKAVAKTGKKIILGAGMATLGEIERSISYINSLGNKKIVLLHCTTNYPTNFIDVNMNVIKSLKKAFDLPVGYSDHTLGIFIPILAVSLGAQVIEKHFTIDRNMVGPDHFASLESEELIEMVKAIRIVESAKGGSKKVISEDERKNIFFMRRSIHVNRDLRKGEMVDKDAVKILRPYDGIEPWFLDVIIGRELKHNKYKNEPLKWEDLI